MNRLPSLPPPPPSGRLRSALGSVDAGTSAAAFSSRHFYYDYDFAGNHDASSQVLDATAGSNAAYKKEYTATLTNHYSPLPAPIGTFSVAR